MGDRRRTDGDEVDRLRFLVNSASEAVLLVAFDGRVLDANPAFTRMLGYTDDEIRTMNTLDLVHPEDLPHVVSHVERHLREGTRIPPTDIRARRSDGQWRWIESRIERHPHDEEVTVVSARDVSERRRSEELLNGQSRVLELIARGAPLADVVQAVSSVIAGHVVEARAAVVLRADASVVLAPELPAEWRRDAVVGLLHGAPIADGMDAWLGTLAARYGLPTGWSTPVRERDGRDLGRIVLYRDAEGLPDEVERQALESLASLITIAVERQAAEARLAYQAHHDELTGLLNRSGFVQELERMLERGDNPRAVLFVDLDRFKEVNDRHGHRVGDQVLTEVSRRLRSNVRQGDLLARFGGDEFVAVLGGVGETDAEAFAGRMLDALDAPILIDGTTTVSVSASVGIAAPGDVEIETSDLLHQADVAMFRAKDGTRSRIVRFAGDDEIGVSREQA